MEKINYECISCTNTELKIIYKNVNGFQILRCLGCHLVSTYPQPSKQELSEMYDSQILSVNGSAEDFANRFILDPERLAKKVGYEHRLQKINEFIKGKKILEVGCAAGLFLYYLQKKGFEVMGSEISPWGFKWAREKLKLDVFQSEIEGLKIPPKSLDGVFMYDVLEHTRDPKLYLKQTNKLLKKDGLLVLNVPNFSSLMAKIRKDLWLKLDPPQHLYHFEKKTLYKLLKDTGFRVVEMNTNTGTNQELGKQLFLQIASAQRDTRAFSFASLYQKYKTLLQPVKRVVYFGINAGFSLLGPVLNKALVKADLGEGIEVYAIKVR